MRKMAAANKRSRCTTLAKDLKIASEYLIQLN